MNQTLLKAAELLAQPDAWTQGALAYDRTGNPVASKSPRACSWCMAGAISKVSENMAERARAYRELVRVLGKPIPQYNDDKRTTQASAVRKLRQAARIAA